MKRKVIKQGHNTLTITLPADWCLQKGIGAGDEIDIDDVEGELVLRKDATPKILTTTFDTQKIGHFKNNYINCLYHAGFDEIEVVFTEPDTMREINKRIRDYCPGFEVITQDRNRCHIKSVSNVLEEDFDVLVRRIFRLTLSLLEEAYESLKTGNYDCMVNVRDLEGLNNRYTSYCKRVLNKTGYHEQSKDRKSVV